MYIQGWTLTYFATCPRTSQGNFHLSEMKIHLPTFGLALIGSIFCSYNCFKHKKRVQILVGSSVRQLLSVVPGS